MILLPQTLLYKPTTIDTASIDRRVCRARQDIFHPIPKHRANHVLTVRGKTTTVNPRASSVEQAN
tara:strand:- start:600 stop:794 length:195 start_codon:yes stop_codon:yes gene_type:complete